MTLDTILEIALVVLVIVGLVVLVRMYSPPKTTPTGATYWQGGTPVPAGNVGLVTQQYQGSLPDATARFNAHAPLMAAQGYFPVNQLYQPGSWGCGAFLIALILCVVLIGILVFIYLIIVKPPGVLVVTYEYRAHPPQAPAEIPVYVAPQAYK